MSREVAAELVGDLLHERDLVAEAFRRCHDVTPPRYPDARVPTRHATCHGIHEDTVAFLLTMYTSTRGRRCVFGPHPSPKTWRTSVLLPTCRAPCTTVMGVSARVS